MSDNFKTKDPHHDPIIDLKVFIELIQELLVVLFIVLVMHIHFKYPGKFKFHLSKNFR